MIITIQHDLGPNPITFENDETFEDNGDLPIGIGDKVEELLDEGAHKVVVGLK